MARIFRSIRLVSVAVVLAAGCGPRSASHVEIAPPPLPPSSQEQVQPEEASAEGPAASGAESVRAAPLVPHAIRTLRTQGNVRQVPDADADVIATLPAGTPVALLALSGGWYRVRTDSLGGWIWAALLNLTDEDQWDAAMSFAAPRFVHTGLFRVVRRNGPALEIVLDDAWAGMSEAEKQRTALDTGTAWQRAADQMGLDPRPPIRFLSADDVEMARWDDGQGAHLLR